VGQPGRGGGPANAARDGRQGRHRPVGDGIADLVPQDQAYPRPARVDLADLVVDHARRERDSPHDVIGDVPAVGPEGHPEAAFRMEAGRDVGKPALEVRQALHEQHDHVHRRQPEIVRDAHIVLTEVPLETARSIEQADLVAGLDPQLFGQWRSRVPSHVLGIMPPRAGRSNRKPQTSLKFSN
jgi:hypothetical protein